MQQPPNYPNYGGWPQPQQPNTQYPPQQPQWQSGTYPVNEPYSMPGMPPQQPYQPWQQPPMPPMMPPVQPPPKKKSRVGLWIALGIVGVLLFGCIGIFALIGTAAKNTTTGAITSSPSTSSTSTTTTNQIAKVGQTITVDSVSTTLVSVKTLQGDEFTQPKPGNEFIVVHVKLVNNGGDEKDYNPFDFHAKSGSGNITDEEIPPSTYTANNQLNSGKLSAGGTVQGDIVFQVPKGDHKAELTWQPSFFGNAGDNAWNLGL